MKEEGQRPLLPERGQCGWEQCAWEEGVVGWGSHPGGADDLQAKSHCLSLSNAFIKPSLSPRCHRESLCTCHGVLKRRCYS